MSKIRAFFAIDTSNENKEKIFEVQNTLKDFESDVKWESKEKFHITLKFLGDIEEAILKEMTNDIRNEVKGFGNFGLQFGGLGCFPNIKFPRVIWIGSKSEDDKIFKLNDKVEFITENYNFPRERGKFHPHITLGRVKGNKGLDYITDAIKQSKFNNINGIANEIIVVKSTLQKSGSVYSIIDKISLTK
jgi:RNA 2',3'-cyclic 3'-phosphodiesterase